LTPQQRYQAILNLHGIALIMQNSFYLTKQGTLDEQIRSSLTAVFNSVKDQPGWKYYWNTRKSIFLKEFQVYVENILASDVPADGIYSQSNDRY
jgi:hypothetical protein